MVGAAVTRVSHGGGGGAAPTAVRQGADGKHRCVYFSKPWGCLPVASKELAPVEAPVLCPTPAPAALSFGTPEVPTSLRKLTLHVSIAVVLLCVWGGWEGPSGRRPCSAPGEGEEDVLKEGWPRPGNQFRAWVLLLRPPLEELGSQAKCCVRGLMDESSS